MAGAAASDDSDDDETVPEVVLVKNSIDHVEEMLIEMFGPESQSEAIKLLKRVKMEKEPAFSKLSLVTNYRRDWKLALRWCRKHTLKGKTLVNHFLNGVQPKQLAVDLGYSDFDNIDEVMDEFIKAYKTGVKAKKNLAGMEVLADEKTSSDRSEKQSAKSGKSEKASGSKDTNVPTSTALVVRGQSTGTIAVATSNEVEC